MSLPVTKGQALRSALTSRPGLYNVALGVLNGATMWHSFIGGPIAFKALPRQQFGHLQSRLFPTFFAMQTTGSALLLAMYTRSRALVRSDVNAWLLGIMTAAGALNWALVGPWTTAIMQRRHRLERLEGTKYNDDVVSPKMAEHNKKFAIAHSVSSLLNLGFVLAVIAHSAMVGAVIA